MAGGGVGESPVTHRGTNVIRVVATVAALSVAALVVTAPGVAAAPSGDDPVEVLIEGGDPFEAITTQATVGSAVGAAWVNLFWGFLSLITAVIDGILNNGYALTLALSNAAVAACHAIGATPLSEFGLFYACVA